MSMIPPQTANVNFTHIAEDLTVPIPPASELENWVIYIGFDPTGRPAAAAAGRAAAPRAHAVAAELRGLAAGSMAHKK